MRSGGETEPKLAPLPPIGSTVEFIYLYELRYVGELAEVNEASGTFKLSNARHFGNENRLRARPLPPLRIPFDSMEFNWHYVYNVRTLSDEEAWKVSLTSLSLRLRQPPPADEDAKKACLDGRGTKTVAPTAKAERSSAEQTKRREAEGTRGKRLLSQINSHLQPPR